jgi:hypothetical protein
MTRTDPHIHLRFWGLRPSVELEATIAEASAPLRAFRDRLGKVELHLGRWALHHAQGHLYRATLTVERKGSAAIDLEEESELDAPATARGEILHAVFARAAARLAKG